MRLARVERGEGPRDRLLVAVVRALGGGRLPDVVRTLRYRPSFFGGLHNALTQEVMRGPSAWSEGERELMAAFVSDLNQCLF